MISAGSDPTALTERERMILDLQPRTAGEVGTIYLLHFSEPFKHAKHYMGWARDLPNRVHEHLSGKGSSLTRAAHAAGVTFTLVRTWEGDRTEERRLKNHNGLSRHCPQCVEAFRAKARDREQRYRDARKARRNATSR